MDSFLKALDQSIVGAEPNFTKQEFLQAYAQEFPREYAKRTGADPDNSLLPVELPANDPNSINLEFFGLLPSEIRRHLFIAGGSCLRALDCKNLSMPPSVDFDCFFVGLTAPEISKLIPRIVKCWHGLTRKVVLTPNALTITMNSGLFVSGRAYEAEYQFILRAYDNIGQVLHGFDLDVCKFGWQYLGDTVRKVKWSDGQFYSTALGLLTLKYHLFVATPFFSYSYEARLYKYIRRGFTLIIPGSKIKMDTEEPLKDYGARLILSYIYSKKASIPCYEDYSDYTGNRPQHQCATKKWKVLLDYLSNDDFIRCAYKLDSKGELLWLSILSPCCFVVSLDELFLENSCYGEKLPFEPSKLIEARDPTKQGSGTFHPRPEITSYEQWLTA